MTKTDFITYLDRLLLNAANELDKEFAEKEVSDRRLNEIEHKQVLLLSVREEALKLIDIGDRTEIIQTQQALMNERMIAHTEMAHYKEKMDRIIQELRDKNERLTDLFNGYNIDEELDEAIETLKAFKVGLIEIRRKEIE